MRHFLKFSLFFIPFLTCQASFDWRGHNRFLASSLMGSPYKHDYDAFSSDLVLNHRSTLLYSRGAHGIELAYELFAQGLYLDKVATPFVSSFLSREYRYVDLKEILAKSHSEDARISYQLFQNLDRLSYTYSTEKYEFIVGRQAISFGPSRVFRPLDILTPFGLTSIHVEQKFGLDALRFKYSYSDMGLIEGGGAWGKELHTKEQYRFFSWRDSFSSVDIRLLAQQLYRADVFGGDIQTDIGGMGFWLESAYVVEYQGRDYLRSSLGGQYYFSNNLNVFFEFHYNGRARPWPLLGMFLWHRRYLSLGLSYPLTPLQSFSLNTTSSLEYNSQLFSANYQYNISQDWYVELGAFIGTGTRGSEFAQYPQNIFTHIKYFF